MLGLGTLLSCAPQPQEFIFVSPSDWNIVSVDSLFGTQFSFEERKDYFAIFSRESGGSVRLVADVKTQNPVSTLKIWVWSDASANKEACAGLAKGWTFAILEIQTTAEDPKSILLGFNHDLFEYEHRKDAEAITLVFPQGEWVGVTVAIPEGVLIEGLNLSLVDALPGCMLEFRIGPVVAILE